MPDPKNGPALARTMNGPIGGDYRLPGVLRDDPTLGAYTHGSDNDESLREEGEDIALPDNGTQKSFEE